MQILHCILGTLLLSICHLVQLNKAADRKWLGPGTTPNLEDIVIGRCYDYIATVNPSVGARNCSAIWAAFRSAFLSKDPCSVFPSDFELFINLTHHDIPANKSLFWENNKSLVKKYTDTTNRYMALGDTLPGWIGDNMQFCGSVIGTDKKEFGYAKKSSGEIQILLNGSTPGGAFPVPSFLSDFEIPNFQRDKVTKINIWVVDEIGGVDVDSCGNNSIAILESLLTSKQFPYECVDNYRPVRILQCVDFPHHADCTTNRSAFTTSSWMIMMTLTFFTLIIVPLLNH
ncbi:ADP-ribosyl cyclase/cyclic ADP-ribose hydrolase 2 [Pyxicephalus adspersus]|uniref:ADP-ribosyl cyclase/cyclic ADP-ribose hydrolase 2 n=1 Tax=Pyxicephalus adspersus TaxID=30357 RepID=UPI003B5A0E98